ncbi:MAG TPA: phospholipase D-like domain-containing protein [Terracidiphilus sp.]|nr:phospholipase D-like domain-containing protein [Terracidiphilus sp.]
MKLIIEPTDGVAPLLSAIKSAKKSIEIAIFRFDRKDVELALKAAADRGVKVNVLIAYSNRGGEEGLRKLELRCLTAGIIVARTADDLIRYHAKYVLIDRRVLCMLSFNFTHLDIDHSRAFGIETTHADWVSEAEKLFRADCTRTEYATTTDTFVVSPANSRNVLGTFLKRSKKELLIYDPKISDKEMLGILQEQAKAGVEIKVIGSVDGHAPFNVQKMNGTRLHTRTIIRDRHQAFVGSQSLRTAELDARREVGLIIDDAKSVAKLVDIFETDWASACEKNALAAPKDPETRKEHSVTVSAREEEKTQQALAKEMDPLAATVKKAVRIAVAKAGDDMLHDNGVKDTMKRVVKQAVKEAVKEAVRDAQEAQDVKEAKEAKEEKSET